MELTALDFCNLTAENVRDIYKKRPDLFRDAGLDVRDEYDYKAPNPYKEEIMDLVHVFFVLLFAFVFVTAVLVEWKVLTTTPVETEESESARHRTTDSTEIPDSATITMQRQ